ncbi:MAG: hypothetical protein HYS09_01865 [Chloroflexi bacterium]|nr:hypothetical protein [Chloroflexota bacterium]
MERTGSAGDGIEEITPSGKGDSYSPLQLHYLRQLDRLLRLRYEQGGQLNPEGVRLLDRAIYSRYCDCMDLGVGTEAQELLRRIPASSVGPRSES